MPASPAISSLADLPLGVILMTMFGGLALFLLGLDLMTDALRRLAGPRMRHLLARLTTNRFTAVLAGAAVTGVIQSSSITTVLVVGFVSAGAMSLGQSVGVIMGANIGTTVTAQIVAFEVTQFALLPVILGFGIQFLARAEAPKQAGRLLLGANVGTCVTAMLAAIGKTRDAVRAALIHVIFNLAGAAVWISFTGTLARLAAALTPDVARQVADAHTIFNVANTLLFIGFTGPMAAFVRWTIPERPPEEEGAARPHYLDELILQTPDLALERVRLELGRIADIISRMLTHASGAVFEGTARELQRLTTLDDDVDALHGAVVQYLRRLSMPDLTGTQSAELRVLLAAANNLEHIGDTIKKDLQTAGLKRIEGDVRFSPETRRHLERMQACVARDVAGAMRSLLDRDRAAARAVLESEAEISRLADTCAEHLLHRLTSTEPGRLELYRIETDLIEALRRVHYFARQIARLVVEEHAMPAPAPPPSTPSA